MSLDLDAMEKAARERAEDCTDERWEAFLNAFDPPTVLRLIGELRQLRSDVIAFCAPWATAYAKDHGLPEGHLDATHYDILQRAGGRMVDFTRGGPEESDDPEACSDPRGHKWVCTGTAYGGEDERWHGEGRCLCERCGADGDG